MLTCPQEVDMPFGRIMRPHPNHRPEQIPVDCVAWRRVNVGLLLALFAQTALLNYATVAVFATFEGQCDVVI
jgi:hypothetical protein